jgi:predicted aminopeptidase
MQRKLALGLMMLVLPGLLSGCTLTYLLRQGWVQAGLLMRRQPLEKVIPTLPKEQQDKLSLMAVGRDWAVANLNMKPIASYKDYIDVPGDTVSHVVQAAESLKLKPYLWSFPVVGAMPYKGFFNPKEADAEKLRLERLGYDTLVRPVSAFSMLGWLPDPLYSPMLRYDTVGLVSTVIHEMTHATLYWKGQADFNESLATYIGSQGAAMFFAAHEGAESPRAKEAAAQARDHLRAAAAFDELESELNALFAKDIPDAEKVARKAEIYVRAQLRFQRLPLETGYHGWLGKQPLNNATLLLNRTYYAGLPLFDKLAKKHDGLGPTLDWLVKQTPPTDPWAWLHQEVGK